MKHQNWFFRIISILLILTLMLSEIQLLHTPVFAEERAKSADQSKKKEKDKEKTPQELWEEQVKKERAARKKIPIETNQIKGWPKGPKTYCESGIMLDLDSGTILYSKNAEKALYPASITKVLTALVALENCELDEKVKFSQDSINILGNGYASIGMKTGEKITMEDALYGMMLASANEVAYAICEHFGGGDYEKGVAMMNEKAKELGCTNSNFVNPNGIFNKKHRTTVHDMARIAQAAYRSETFQKIINTRQYTIKKTKKSKEDRTFQNHHKMLWPDSEYYYKYCIGGKTGYTSEALNTLVTFAEKDGRRLLCVTMKTRGEDTYKDTKKILNYGFQHFQNLSISENETADIFDEICEGTCVTIPADASFQELEYTTDRQNDNTINLRYHYHDYDVGNGIAEVSGEKTNEIKIGETFDTGSSRPEGKLEKLLSPVSDLLKQIPVNEKKKYLLAGVGILIILLIAIRVILSIRRRKKRKKRRRKSRRKRR